MPQAASNILEPGGTEVSTSAGGARRYRSRSSRSDGARSRRFWARASVNGVGIKGHVSGHLWPFIHCFRYALVARCGFSRRLSFSARKPRVALRYDDAVAGGDRRAAGVRAVYGNRSTTVSTWTRRPSSTSTTATSGPKHPQARRTSCRRLRRRRRSSTRRPARTCRRGSSRNRALEVFRKS